MTQLEHGILPLVAWWQIGGGLARVCCCRWQSGQSYFSLMAYIRSKERNEEIFFKAFLFGGRVRIREKKGVLDLCFEYFFFWERNKILLFLSLLSTVAFCLIILGRVFRCTTYPISFNLFLLMISV